MLIPSEMSENLFTEEFSQLHVLIHVNETTTKYGFTKSQTLQYVPGHLITTLSCPVKAYLKIFREM
jgi:hypothetical protein